jgi:hypothetical protein
VSTIGPEQCGILKDKPLRGRNGLLMDEISRRHGMIRLAAPIVALAVCSGSVLWAQSAGGETDDTRYTFKRADEGYLRLDGRTGQVSLCTRRVVGWACQAVPDERTALEGEIARLQGENAVLKKELLAHDLPLPGVVKPEPPQAKPPEPSLQLPDATDLNKLMSFIENVWRRLVEMITTLQKDILRKT